MGTVQILEGHVSRLTTGSQNITENQLNTSDSVRTSPPFFTLTFGFFPVIQ
jgi:hypothetical protein